MKKESLEKILLFAEPAVPIAIVTILESIAGDKGIAKIKSTDLGDLLHVSKFIVSRYTKRLKEIGVIHYEKFNRSPDGKNNTREYIIL